MANGMNKIIAELLGKMDEKVLQAKINSALDMLKNGKNEELAKKLNKMDKNDLLSKINELDETKLKNLNLDKDDLKQKMGEVDFAALQKLIGEQGEEIIRKIKDIIK